jgi:hypothetical protein
MVLKLIRVDVVDVFALRGADAGGDVVDVDVDADVEVEAGNIEVDLDTVLTA